MRHWVLGMLIIGLFACRKQKSYSPQSENCTIPSSSRYSGDYTANFLSSKIIIDGSQDSLWNKMPWHPIATLVKGQEYSPQDFQGRYKILWDEENLYFLTEIVDNDLQMPSTAIAKSTLKQDAIRIDLVLYDSKDTLSNKKEDINSFMFSPDGSVVSLAMSESNPFNSNSTIIAKRVNHRGRQHTWELKIPYKELIKEKKFKEGGLFKFALSYYDSDGTTGKLKVVSSIRNLDKGSENILVLNNLGLLQLME